MYVIPRGSAGITNTGMLVGSHSGPGSRCPVYGQARIGVGVDVQRTNCGVGVTVGVLVCVAVGQMVAAVVGVCPGGVPVPNPGGKLAALTEANTAARSAITVSRSADFIRVPRP